MVSGNILYLQWSQLSQSISLERDCSETVLWLATQLLSLCVSFSLLLRNCIFSKKYSGTICASVSQMVGERVFLSSLMLLVVRLLRRLVLLPLGGLRLWSRRRSPCRKEQLRLYRLRSESTRLVSSLPKMRGSMCLLNQIIIIDSCTLKFIMRYHELTYHKANPFYKQDFIPDIAWLNRKPKDYPSEIPTGQEYFVESGRRHYINRFNHSQIDQTNILKSPERFPFENRIAFDKSYMRNLDTIDIEGASSGTRMNQSIKNKLKAQEELSRRHNQSVQLRNNKERTDDERRRDIANKQYETLQERKKQQYQLADNSNSRIKQNLQNESTQRQVTPSRQRERKPSIQAENSATYGNKYISLVPKPYDSSLPQPKGSSEGYLSQNSRAHEEEYHQNIIRQYSDKHQTPRQQQKSVKSDNGNSIAQKQASSQGQRLMLANNRHGNNPEYSNGYDAELIKRREQHSLQQQMDEMTRNKMTDKKELRKYNPTNLSLSLAAQSIVGNMN